MLTWSGQYLLGGTTNAFGPRVSPNGDWLAFLVLRDNQAQVAVMKLKTGEWWPLTKTGDGGPLSLCWDPDSTRVYFDRWLDVPKGVFSVSPLEVLLGTGTERQVADRAECPQALADGTLVVCKLDADGNTRLHRLWPDGRDVEVSPPLEFQMGWPSPVRVLHGAGQNKVVFCGKVLDRQEEGGPRRRFYVLDLDLPSAGCQPLREEPSSLVFVQIAVSPDNKYVYTTVPKGEAFDIVRFPLGGEGPVQTRHTLLNRVWGFDVDANEKIYLDQFQRRAELLRFDPTGNTPVERLANLGRSMDALDDLTGNHPPVEFPDGRVLLASKVLGHDNLLVVAPGKEPTVFASPGVETALPAIILNDHQLVCMAGPRTSRAPRIFSLRGEPMSTIKPIKGTPVGLAASPRGDRLYYCHSREIWEVPIDDSKEPCKIAAADGVAVSPQTGELLLQRYEKTRVRLSWRSKEGIERDIDTPAGPVRIVPAAIGPRTIHADNSQLLVTVVSPDMWFWRPAILKTSGKLATLEPIRVDFEGDVNAGWSKDGKVLGMGHSYRGELWRLTPNR
jgi:sugar lactone lactonase YvrE